MRTVKSANTKPEIIVRKFLFLKGLRYRLHDKKLPGTPDIKLSKYKCAIFINGCFWHGHECRKQLIPKSNVDFWEAKIAKNISRDENALKDLQKLGWKVITIWECELKKKELPETLEKLYREILQPTNQNLIGRL